jgi:hypothetical protein
MAVSKPVPAVPANLGRAVAAKILATLRSVAGPLETAKGLAASVSRAMEARALRLRVFMPAITRSVEDIGTSTSMMVRRLRALLPENRTVKAVLAVMNQPKPEFEKVLERLPAPELIELLDKELPRLVGATKPTRAEIVKRIANALNEWCGVFHPDVIGRMRALAKAILQDPLFRKEFEFLDSEPSAIFQLRAAGVKGSDKPFRLFVDARYVLRVRRITDDKIMFVKLGSVQVKSTNVAELLEQFLTDELRETRGTDFAYRNRQGGLIPATAFIDPAKPRLALRGLIQPIGVGHGQLDPRRVTMRNPALKPVFIESDVPLKTLEAMARAIADAYLSLGK